MRDTPRTETAAPERADKADRYFGILARNIIAKHGLPESATEALRWAFDAGRGFEADLSEPPSPDLTTPAVALAGIAAWGVAIGGGLAMWGGWL